MISADKGGLSEKVKKQVYKKLYLIFGAENIFINVYIRMYRGF